MFMLQECYNYIKFMLQFYSTSAVRGACMWKFCCTWDFYVVLLLYVGLCVGYFFRILCFFYILFLWECSYRLFNNLFIQIYIKYKVPTLPVGGHVLEYLLRSYCVLLLMFFVRRIYKMGKEGGWLVLIENHSHHTLPHTTYSASHQTHILHVALPLTCVHHSSLLIHIHIYHHTLLHNYCTIIHIYIHRLLHHHTFIVLSTQLIYLPSIYFQH